MLTTLLSPRAVCFAGVLALAAAPFAAAQSGSPDLSKLLFEVAPSATAPVPVLLPPPQAPADGTGDTLGSIADYESAVAAIEEEFGPYANELAEQFQSLASLYEEEGDHLKAIETYEKAMHIVRVNNGLFTLRQTALVENIIRNYEAMLEFREADNRQEYLYYLKQKNYQNDDPEMIRAMFQWADWNVQAYYRRLDGENSRMRVTTSSGPTGPGDYIPVYGPNNRVTYVPRAQGFGSSYALTNSYLQSGMPGNGGGFLIDPRLRTARDLYEEIADAVESAEAADPAVLPETERKLANISYIVKQEMDYMRSQMTSSNLYYNRAFRPEANPEVSRGYVNGRDGLESVLERLREDPEATPERIAGAAIDLADWHLTFDRPQRAFEEYRKAWELLAGAGYGESEIEAVFAPLPAVEIPAYATHRYSRRTLGIPPDAEVAYRGFIDLKLSVDRYGNPRRTEVMETSEETPYDVRKTLREHVRAAKLRPKLVNGETVGQDDIVLRYYYSY